MSSPQPELADQVLSRDENVPREAHALRAALALAGPSVKAPCSVRTMLLARATPPDQLPARFAIDTVEWEPTPFPGISQHVLERDHGNARATILLKLEPGSLLPEHSHPGVEEFLILHGDLHDADGVTWVPGHYQRSTAGSVHEEQWTRTGCVALLVLPIEMLSSESKTC